MGDQILESPFEGLDIDAVVGGLADSLNRVEPALPDAELEAAFVEVRAQIQAQQAQAASGQAAAGEAFLAANALRDEIEVTETGLQYEILVRAEGARPLASSTVRTHYHGTLTDGTVFDSSYQRGEPAEFPVNGVIPGWAEALQMMPVGSRWRLYLPYQLAYGERGAGGIIGPYASLVFEVELLEIVN